MGTRSCVKKSKKECMLSKNKWFLFFVMNIEIYNYGMDLVLPKDIIRKMQPYFTLQTISCFGQTSKAHAKIFNLEKIKNIKPYFSVIEDDYHLCTHALARFAQSKNVKIFKHLYYFDEIVRNDHLRILEGQPVISLPNQMKAYRLHYNSSEEIEKRITEQLRNAILQKKGNVVEIIVRNKNYNIFKLFNDDSTALAFEYLCKLALDDVDYLLNLFPEKSDKYKNKMVEYLAKFHGGGELLYKLLKNNYFKINEELEHKCIPLHYAVLSGNPKLFNYLLEKGTFLNIANKWGKTPFDYIVICKERKSQSPYNLMPYIWMGINFEIKLEYMPTEWSATENLKNIKEEEAAWLSRSCVLYEKKSKIQ